MNSFCFRTPPLANSEDPFSCDSGILTVNFNYVLRHANSSEH